MEGESKSKEEMLPPGFRFHPTDEELITFYLINKISDAQFTGRAIADVDLNKCEPWELPGKAKMGEKEWYFFSLRDRKYPTGVRTNRATNTGYWKTTGKDREIFNSTTSELVGMKKTLVFYRGRAPRGEKSNWVMHEYRIHAKSSFRSTKDDWVVCRIFQKSAGVKKYPTNQSRPAIPPYNLEIGPSIMPSAMMQSENFHLLGRNYLCGPDLSDLNDMVLRSGSLGVNYPQVQQHQLINPGSVGSFTISGLNLNIGGSIAAQPVHRSVEVIPALNPQEVASSMVAANNQLGPETSYGGEDINSSASVPSNRYMGTMENCMELDGYWPPYPVN